MTSGLRISSKKLRSGRFQVNFSTSVEGQGYYGYLLAEPRTSVSDIVARIAHHVRAATQRDRYLQPSLFSMGRKRDGRAPILLFKREAA